MPTVRLTTLIQSVNLFFMLIPLAKKDRKAFSRILSGLCINLSAGWYGVVLIAPNFWPVGEFKNALVLTYDVLSGTLFLYFAFILERKL